MNEKYSRLVTMTEGVLWGKGPWWNKQGDESRPWSGVAASGEENAAKEE